ncbi:MAG: NAD(P)-dependent oxidoreductase [Bacteroidetes bacterium CG2_30_33_31]|nr:MAG: NAD(P)-dependent oxidoreductase [Bacteroidetes bacterium CG2_30_33_31]
MIKTVFITGATSGIGKACAYQFGANEHNLILCGRRNERLIEIKSELETKFKIKVFTMNFDVRNQKQVESAILGLPKEWQNIDILINNAGLAVGLNKIQEGEIDDWERMIDTNIKGLLYVTRAVSPLMIARKSGHIINIGSIAGRETYPFGNIYCATKSAVDSLSKAMRIDMVEFGIKVTQIAPGAIETEFSIVRFKGDTAKADSIYAGYEPLHPEDIADAAYYCANLPSHVNINDMLIMPTAQASSGVFHKVIE